MQFWRSLFRNLLIFGLGATVAILIHACQTEPSSTTPSPASAVTTEPVPQVATPAKITPAPLPKVTQAIVNRHKNLVNPPRGEIRLAVISDLNSAYGSTDYDPEVKTGINLLPFWQPDLVLCSGDMVAGQSPSLSDPQLQAMWQAFDQYIAAPLRQFKLPFGFTMGNHDASGALSASGNFIFDRERKIASQYWQDPEHNTGLEFIDRQDFPFYYAFKYQDVFFLAWDGSTDLIPEQKLAWVQKALQSPEAKAAKLKILIGHLPLYAIATGRNRAGEVMSNNEKLRSLLEQNQVHTYISGHQHAYYPAYKGKLQLLHTGALGSGPRTYIDSQMSPRKTMTIIDINFNSPEITTYTTYDMPTLQVIQNEELPRSITGVTGTVLRRDVKG
jgi:hypothetical protein